ncbi:MAG: HD domain-containing protein [Candidatus Pacebacteria bacterium]|nr:HD domain-containing protein [Candidatus Paceibacterota bacterium]
MTLEMNKINSDYSLNSIFAENKDLYEEDRILIKKAYNFAKKAHENQLRKSGEPYFNHLVATAKILAHIKMDGTVISAGLLHDSIEDGVATKENIIENFGQTITFLVDGVTKLEKVRFRGMRRHNESLRKLFVATSKDIRVLIIKFADRIHNLSTLDALEPEKQKRIATESFEIYTPLAYRLGIISLSTQLGDLSFPYVMPDEYRKVRNILKERSMENMKNLEKFRRSLLKKLAKENIKNFKITNRVKSLLALYKKLLNKD